MLRLGKKYYTLENGARRRWFVLFVLLAVLFVGGGGVIGYKLLANKSKPISTQKKTEEKKVAEAPAENKTIKGKYLFSGTIVLARAVERFANGNYDQPFSKLSTFKPEQYDGWLADLECPVTDTVVSYQQQVDNLIFNCRPEWLPSMRKYFNFMNLANNHSGNLGEEGFQKTRNYLTDAGFQVIGNYDPSVNKDICQIFSLPVRVVGKKTDKAQLPVAFCAVHYFFRNPYPGEMDIIKKYSEIMPVFGFMHAGVEYVPTAGAEQRNIGHTLIDNGAEFVVANSPHWVQDAEAYKGKPIFYSTGNFIFDQLDAETNRGLNVDVSMEVPYSNNLQKWLDIGPDCKDLYDTCFDKIKELGLEKPKLKLTYEPIANISGVRVITEKASPAIQAGVEQRLNWVKVKTQLVQ